MVDAQALGLVVNGEHPSSRLNDDHHIDVVVDMTTDAGIGVETNEVGIEISAMRQTPDRPSRTHGSGEVNNQRSAIAGRLVVDAFAVDPLVVYEVRPAGRIATTLGSAHGALRVSACSTSGAAGNAMTGSTSVALGSIGDMAQAPCAVRTVRRVRGQW